MICKGRECAARRRASRQTSISQANQWHSTFENFFPRAYVERCSRVGRRSSTMADKGLSITPCNNAAIRQASRMLGQLYDDALAPSGLPRHPAQFARHDPCDGCPTLREMATALVMDLGAGPLPETAGPPRLGRGHDRCARPPRQTRDADQSGIEEASGDGAAMAQAQNRFDITFGSGRAEELRESRPVISTDEFRQAFRDGRPLAKRRQRDRGL